MTRIVFEFDETKATQVIGLWVKRCGGLFDYYVAMKAIYAMDRAAILRWNQPVVGGEYRMLPFGPLNQTVYDATKPERQGMFAACFERFGNEIRLKADPGIDELSQAEVELAELVCDEWKDLGFTGAHEKAMSFPECAELMGVVSWISIESILSAEGRDAAAIAELACESSLFWRLQRA